MDLPPSLPGEDSRDVVVPLLLAAFVIVVGSFLATVLLEMGQTAAENDLAGASVEFRTDLDAVFVRFTSMERPDTAIEVTVSNATTGGVVATARLTTVGQLTVFDSLQDGHRYEVVVVAEWRDRRSLVVRKVGTV